MLTATNCQSGDQADPAIEDPEAPAKRRRRPPLWAKLLIGFGIVILVISLGAFVTYNLALDKIDRTFHQNDLLPPEAAAPVDGHTIDGALNILLLGTDERPGLPGNRADSIIILHVNADHDGVYLLSIPRDTLASIPAYPKTNFPGGKSKINGAFEFGSRNGAGRIGGFELLATTVSNLTGIKFNGAAIINFGGFTSIVEVLGGVDMYVDQETMSFDHDTNGDEWHYPNKRMVYHVGYQHLAPWQALDYVRQREFLKNGDYDRQRHQQQFIKAVANQAISKGLTDPTKLGRLLDAAGEALTVDRHGIDLKDWIFTFKNLPVNDMTMLRTNGGDYASLDCPDGSSCQVLTPESLRMFEAAKNDTLTDFVKAHPTWIAGDDAIQASATPTRTPPATTRSN
jgi:polyisoprenyl-teichoic acid--peptidoglycan teichoic acid transferase